MRALNFIENNRPGDARSDANRRAVRSWAARDPMLKTGERSKRRRKRYKPTSVVFMDDRAIEALQGTTLPPNVNQDGEQSTSDSANHSASPAQQPPHLFAQENHAHSPQLPCNRETSVSESEQGFPNQNYYPHRTNTIPLYPSALQVDLPYGQARAGQAEPSAFLSTPRNRPMTVYRHFGPPLDTERPNSGSTNFQPAAVPQQYHGSPNASIAPGFARPMSNPTPRQGFAYSESPVDYPRTNSVTSTSTTYSSRQDDTYPGYLMNQQQQQQQQQQQRTNSLPNPTRATPADSRPFHQSSGSLSLPAIRTPPLAKRQQIQLPPLLAESRNSILGSNYSDSPVSALPKDTSFAAFASHHRFPSLPLQSTPPMVESVTTMQEGETPLREGSSPGRRMSVLSNSATTPFPEAVQTPRSPPQVPSPEQRATSTNLEAESIASQTPTHHGTLSRLPPEIRAKIYSHLLVSSAPSTGTYGPKSGISTAILSTCRAVYCEAVDILYTHKHLITLNTGKNLQGSPNGITNSTNSSPYTAPLRAISRMRSLTLAITFNTINRGDCETSIQNPNHLVTLTEPIALSLLHSTALTNFTILLLNNTQRKTGLNRFRLQAVSYEMKRILFPFAYLKRRVEVEVAGFDTLDFAEAFVEMRNEFAGREPPIKALMDDALMEG